MKRPSQSVAVGVGMPLQVAVTESPGATVVGLTLRVGGCGTVKALLTARRVRELLAKSRSS